MSFGTLNFGASSQPSTQLNLGCKQAYFNLLLFKHRLLIYFLIVGKPAQTGGLSFGTTASSTLPTSTGIGSGFGLSSLTTNKTTPSFSLGGTTQSGASSSLTPQTGTSSLGLSLTSASSTAAAPTATGVSLTSAAPSTSSVLGSSQQTTNSNSSITYKVLEDYINKWMGDLEAQEKDFLNQATQLNALDKLMMDNGDKVFYKLIQSFYVKKAIGTFNLSK